MRKGGGDDVFKGFELFECRLYDSRLDFTLIIFIELQLFDLEEKSLEFFDRLPCLVELYIVLGQLRVLTTRSRQLN